MLYTKSISRKGDWPLEHYFTNNQNLKSELRKLSFKYKDIVFSFFSDNGVFSKDKIDYASTLLIDTFIKNSNSEKKTLLDVGCGYGFLGIVAGKVLNIKTEFIDINKRAVHLCNMNIKENGVDGVSYESNIYECVKNKYDYIITNPPIRAGKDVVLKILLEAKNYLNEDGELWFVINKNQGAKSTKKVLEECYNIEVMAKSKGFYCYKAKIG